MKTENEMLIIIDTNNSYGDNELHKFFRTFNVDYETGTYYDCDLCGNTKACIWYLIHPKDCAVIQFLGLRDLDQLIKGNYKILSENYFSCNCAEVDLPMIEDIWEIIKN